MITVFTICSNNYLAQAVTLGKSLIHFNPGYKFIIGLADRKSGLIDYLSLPFTVLEAEDIGIESYRDMYEKYNITELSTAVKPYFFKYFFKGIMLNDSIIYLDPDILVYSSCSDLESELSASDIIITPHFLTPLNDNKLQAEEDFLSSGIYNLGFIALKKSTEAEKMLDWWASRLFDKAFIDLKRGLFTDQKWINFVPLFFKNVKIFLHPGYNMAYWNLHERSLKSGNDGLIVNNEFPLVFYHFSGFNPLVRETLSKYQNRFSLNEIPGLRMIFMEYADKLMENGYTSYIKIRNYYEGIREGILVKKRKEMIRKLPLLIRLIRIIVIKLSAKRNLYLD
jgi:lipopolysaccharide biosynthesis glycosyltransferase